MGGNPPHPGGSFPRTSDRHFLAGACVAFMRLAPVIELSTRAVDIDLTDVAGGASSGTSRAAR